MASDWPSTLPSAFLQDGFGTGGEETAYRSRMDQGPSKTRPKTSATIAPYQGSIVMTTAQIVELDDFYFSVLEEGSLPFNFPNPFSPQTTLECRFLHKYSIAYWAYDKWVVNMTLEQSTFA